MAPPMPNSTTSALPLGPPDFDVEISTVSSIVPSTRASNNVMGINHFLERSMYLELALAAIDELVKLAQTDEPPWLQTLEGGRDFYFKQVSLVVGKNATVGIDHRK
ncbi:hypothetical protein L1887_31629 [Cichorium endivia]|nr:hypothetical protein L1887_31629 [Cichorium endivia]